MRFRAAAFLVAFASLIAPAGAADLPSPPWKYDNPFCQVLAQVAPAYDGSGYGLALFAAAGEKLDAHVTLISDSDAYDAHVIAPLFGPPEDRQSAPIIVKLPVATGVKYFFVDSYAVDGDNVVTCPSYVFPVGDALSDVPAGVQTIPARHLQALGALKCGHAYIPPKMHGDLESPVGVYGGRPLTVVARAYVDSNGYSIKEEIVESSGVDGMDKFMLGAVGVHQFTPAEFLCVPVVGTTEIELKYFP